MFRLSTKKKQVKKLSKPSEKYKSPNNVFLDRMIQNKKAYMVSSLSKPLNSKMCFYFFGCKNV